MINRYLNLSWFSRWSLPRCQTSFNSGPCEFAKFQKTPRMRRLLHIWWIGLWPMSFPRWQNFDILSHFPAELHTRKKLIFGYPSNIMDFLERKWHVSKVKNFWHACYMSGVYESFKSEMDVVFIASQGEDLRASDSFCRKEAQWWLTWWLEGNFHGSRWQGVKA